MMQQNLMGALPVPVDRVLYENFDYNAPNVQVSFNFDVLPQMQPYNQMVGGYLIKVLQDNATRNELRTLSFNLLSQNRWSNNDFGRVFVAVSDYAYLLFLQTNNMEQAIVQAAGQVASCLAAIYSEQYPMMKQNIPPNTMQELAGLLQQYNQIASMVAQMRQQTQGGYHQGNPNQGGYQQPNQYQGGYNQPNQYQGGYGNQPPAPRTVWGNQPNPNQGWGNQGNPNQGWGNQNQGGWNGQQPQQVNTAEAVVNRTSDRNSYSTVSNNPVPTPTNTQHQPVSGGMDAILDEWGSETQTRHGTHSLTETQRVATPQPMHQPTQQSSTSVLPKGPNKTMVLESLTKPAVFKAINLSSVIFFGDFGIIDVTPGLVFDQLVTKEGEEYRPAHKSGWVVTYNPEKPYGVLYDPEEYIKYHARKLNDDGTFTVREELIKITGDSRESMEYINHEIRKIADYKLGGDGKVAEIPWGVLGEKEPLPLAQLATLRESQENLEEGQEPTPLESVVLKLDRPCHTLAEAELHCYKEMICNAVPDTVIVEYSYDEVTPLVLEKPQLSRMSELRGCTDLLELAATLREIDIDKTLYRKLNSRLTQAVNEAVAYNLGYGTALQIEDFAMDIVDLGEELRKDGLFVMWNTLNKERYTSIVLPVLEVLVGSDQSEYLHPLTENTPKEQLREYQNVLSLVETNVVVRLPGIFADVFSTTEALQVTKEMSPEVLGAVRASFGRHHSKDSKTQIRHHYLVDSVGNVLEVHRGWLIHGSMLVRRLA